MCLVDLCGISIEVDEENFVLDNYYRNNNFKPSKHKLYVMYRQKVLMYYYIIILKMVCRKLGWIDSDDTGEEDKEQTNVPVKKPSKIFILLCGILFFRS